MRIFLIVGVMVVFLGCQNQKSLNSQGFSNHPGSLNTSNSSSPLNLETLITKSLSQAVAAPVLAFTLEANAGPIVFNQLNDINGTSSIAGCAADKIQRDCLKDLWTNYAHQGVTGIRFMFDLNVDGWPFNSDGSINPAFLANVATVFADMKAAGIINITPTPNWASWTAPSVQTVFDACQNKNVALWFFKATPYAFDPANGFPYDFSDNSSYNCSPENPIFVGWTNIYRLLDGVIASAQTAGLGISEFDIQNEINVEWFPVQARLIYDNKHSSTGDPNVYGHIRTLMSNHGFNPGNATYSAVGGNVSVSKFDCLNAHGDSGRLTNLSGLMDAIAGKPFGHPANFYVQNKLLCGGTLENMAQLKAAQPLPDVFDIHAYICVETPDGSCDPNQVNNTFADAGVLYNDMADFLNVRQKSSAVFMVGETQSMQFQANGLSCEDQAVSSTTPAQMRNALMTSRLNSDNGRSPSMNVLRPWSDIYGSCYSIYAVVNPPYVNVNVPIPPPQNPILSVSQSYAFPTVAANEAKSYAILKGTNLATDGTNEVISNCQGLEKIYDGADGGGDPQITQINVRVSSQNLPFKCTFQIKSFGSSLSNELSLTLPPVAMTQPKITAAGSGCNACECGWIVGSGFYAGGMALDIRDQNWNVVGKASTFNFNGTTSMSFVVPSNLTNLYMSTGLRFTVLNTMTSRWDTSDLVICKP